MQSKTPSTFRLAVLAGLTGALVGEGPLRISRLSPLPRLVSTRAPSLHGHNGGQKRKRAIRAARLRKHGRRRFGRFHA